MKKRIKKFSKDRKNFLATFEGSFIENDYFGNQIKKIVFSNIIDNDGILIKDKQEFIFSGEFNLSIGDEVQFDARITKKAGSYIGSRKNINQDDLEIKLVRLTKITKK